MGKTAAYGWTSGWIGWLIMGLLCASAATAQPADRVALVIGNAAYEVGRLNNPVNDATDVGAALRSVGFEVVEARNASREDMLRALSEFRTKIRPGGLAVAYYSGHGVEVDGQNWLLPVKNAEIRTQADVPIYSVSAQDVLRKMEEGGARLNFLILDACRDNPLPAGAKSASKGLGRMDTGTSTLVAYATSPGKTAADGTGRNSPYTAVLKEALKTPGLSVTDLVNQVGAQVQQSTGGAQVPWNSGTPIWPPVMLAGRGVVSQASPSLPAGEGELRIEVSPAGATVRLDGVLLGTGSRSVRQASGKTVLVRAEAAGHEALEERVLVQGGQVADVVLRLKRLGGASRPDPVVTRPEPVAASSVPLPALVEVPGGTFQMGSPSYEGDRQEDEGPVRDVRIKAFRMGKYEVTRGEFGRFVSATGYRTDAERNTAVGGSAEGCFAYKGGTDFGWKAGTSWRDPGYAQEDDHPVVCVSWNDAQEYVKWLNGETGRRYRLPSEAEQEYAVRATSRTAYVWGNDANGACAYANVADASAKGRFSGATTVSCNDGSVFTRSVGRYEANRFGLYDTVGNVWEWGQDCYKDSYRDAPVDGSAVEAGGCERRVLRGAAWSLSPAWLRSANRFWSHPAFRNTLIGFRLAEDL